MKSLKNHLEKLAVIQSSSKIKFEDQDIIDASIVPGGQVEVEKE